MCTCDCMSVQRYVDVCIHTHVNLLIIAYTHPILRSFDMSILTKVFVVVKMVLKLISLFLSYMYSQNFIPFLNFINLYFYIIFKDNYQKQLKNCIFKNSFGFIFKDKWVQDIENNLFFVIFFLKYCNSLIKYDKRLGSGQNKSNKSSI